MAEEASLPIRIVDYDPAWPARFAAEAARIRAALGARILRLEHAGSTSVPGLGAKPVLDILLVVADSRDEAAYAPPLQAASFRLTLREPHWHEHRMFEGAGVRANLHVFSAGCPEIERMLVFRDWLRAHAADRELYLRAKRALAPQPWPTVQDYAHAKTGVIEAILARAQAARGTRAAGALGPAPTKAKRSAGLGHGVPSRREHKRDARRRRAGARAHK